MLVTRQKYDRAGNLSEVTDPSGMVTKYEYDALAYGGLVFDELMSLGLPEGDTSTLESGS